MAAKESLLIWWGSDPRCKEDQMQKLFDWICFDTFWCWVIWVDTSKESISNTQAWWVSVHNSSIPKLTRLNGTQPSSVINYSCAFPTMMSFVSVKEGLNYTLFPACCSHSEMGTRYKRKSSCKSCKHQLFWRGLWISKKNLANPTGTHNTSLLRCSGRE